MIGIKTLQPLSIKENKKNKLLLFYICWLELHLCVFTVDIYIFTTVIHRLVRLKMITAISFPSPKYQTPNMNLCSFTPFTRIVWPRNYSSTERGEERDLEKYWTNGAWEESGDSLSSTVLLHWWCLHQRCHCWKVSTLPFLSWIFYFFFAVTFRENNLFSMNPEENFSLLIGNIEYLEIKWNCTFYP